MECSAITIIGKYSHDSIFLVVSNELLVSLKKNGYGINVVGVKNAVL